MKPTDINEVWMLYLTLGSVHHVGALFGISGDTVHQHLRNAGYKLNGSRWSEDELAELRRLYEETHPDEFSIEAVAKALKRSYASVALKASRLGLADMTRPKSMSARERNKAAAAGRWDRNPHPRGMAGKKHSDAAKSKLRERMRQQWQQAKATGTGWMSEANAQRRSDAMSARQASNPRMRKGYSRGAAGRRADLGNRHFRSSWEANYARYLNYLQAQGKIKRWEFEPDTFWFEEIKRGVRSYLPDFKVWPADGGDPYYIEVKGWMDAKSATKLKRMAKYYPHIKIKVVDQTQYRFLEGWARDNIPGWEWKGSKSAPQEAPEEFKAAPGWLAGRVDAETKERPV